jgi:hypothetical protein
VDTLYGYVTGLASDEFGYMSLREFETTRHKPFGLTVERDRYFTPAKLSECIAKRL